MSVVYLHSDREGWADREGRHPDAVNTTAANVATGAVECVPLHCANGHLLAPPVYFSSWMPCTCAGLDYQYGHRVVGCVECGHEWFYPPHTGGDTAISGWRWGVPDRVRHADVRASTEPRRVSVPATPVRPAAGI